MQLSNGIHSADSYTSPQWENIVRAQRPCPIVHSAVHNPPQWEYSLSSLLPESPWCESAFHRHWLQLSLHSKCGLNAAQAATGLIVPQVAAPDMQLTACCTLLSCLCRGVTVLGNYTMAVHTTALSIALSQAYKLRLSGRANCTSQQPSLTWMSRQWEILHPVSCNGLNVIPASVSSDRKASAKE